MKSSRPATRTQTGHNRRRGQTLIFVLITLVVLAFVLFSVYDVQRVTGTRIRGQNACDAAAVAGARWQLSALNAIGELNLLKVTTQIIDEPPSPYPGPVPNQRWRELLYDIDTGLTRLQRQIRVLGPWLGVFYGERAAKMNGLENVPIFANEIQEYVAIYRASSEDWIRQQLADLVQAIVDQGVGARPWGTEDWGELLSQISVEGRTSLTSQLFNASFYQAVAAQDWCYLLHAGFYAEGSYECTYGSATTSWGRITLTNTAYALTPYLRLCVNPVEFDDPQRQLAGSVEIMRELAQQPGRNLGRLNPNFEALDRIDDTYPNFTDPTDGRFYVPLRLYAYDPMYWDWNRRRSDDANEAVLMRRSFQSRFRYEGADSRWDVMPKTDLIMTPARPDQVSWTSPEAQGGLASAFSKIDFLAGSSWGVIPRRGAAKAFGCINESTPPNNVPIVLPVFTDVRLVPLTFSSGTGRFDPLLWGHIRHLEPYTHLGISAISSGCPYCAALILWENPKFREMGTDWLKARSNNGTIDPCPPPPPGGPGGPGQYPGQDPL